MTHCQFDEQIISTENGGLQRMDASGRNEAVLYSALPDIQKHVAIHKVGQATCR